MKQLLERLQHIALHGTFQLTGWDLVEARRLCENIETKKVKSVEKKDGYEVRTEDWTGFGRTTETVSAYNPKGDYIGSEEDAEALVTKRGIAPEVASLNGSVCSIGFCEKENKWYGWSHRAIYGFGIGSKVGRDNCAYSPKKGEWIAETLDDAKQMAIDFAEGVS